MSTRIQTLSELLLTGNERLRPRKGRLSPHRSMSILHYARCDRHVRGRKAFTDKNGRVLVQPDLSIPDYPEVFAIGDTAAVLEPSGKLVPGIAPAAKQEGAFVAAAIIKRIAGDSRMVAFRYNHQGSLAQIGKSEAVIDFGWVRLRGAIAWWMWGIAHIYFLVGVRSRLGAAISWLWIYLRNQRSSRLITDPAERQHRLEDILFPLSEEPSRIGKHVIGFTDKARELPQSYQQDHSRARSSMTDSSR